MRSFNIGIKFPSDLAFTADSRGLVAVAGVTLLYWDLTSSDDQFAWADEFRGLLFRFAASPRGRYLAGAEDRCLVVWDLDARRPGKWLEAGDAQHIADVAFTPDGREVLTVLLEGGGVVRRRVGSWRKLGGFGASSTRMGRRRAFFDGLLAVSPDGLTLATTHREKGEEAPTGIKLWHLPTRAHRKTKVLGPGGIWQLAYSPDGRVLAAQHDYRRVCLYDAGTLAPLAEYAPPPPNPDEKMDAIVRMVFHPGGRLLGVSGRTTVTLLETEGLRPMQAFDWGIGRTTGLAFSPDGTLAAVTGQEGQVVVWDLE